MVWGGNISFFGGKYTLVPTPPPDKTLLALESCSQQVKVQSTVHVIIHQECSLGSAKLFENDIVGAERRGRGGGWMGMINYNNLYGGHISELEIADIRRFLPFLTLV